MDDAPRTVSSRELRVLLLPPTRRDGDAIEKLLKGSGIECVICSSMAQLCDEISRGAGAVVVAEESLTNAPDALIFSVHKQPVWSDLSIVVLSRSGVELPKLTAVLPYLGNASVVERPVRITTLLAMVRSALRGRERQYEVREQLEIQKAIEQELRESEARRAVVLEAERAARNEAERAGRMKDEFLATLSHELRTPLNAILGWSHILAARPPSEAELAEGLSTIERNARAQTLIIEDLLDMSRIISGKVRLEVQRTSLAPIVQAAVDTIKPAADAKGVKLQVVLDPNAGPIGGDPNRLQQVFWNLLSNAVKFTPRDKRVQVLLESVHSHVEVSVIDTGVGISAEFLPHMFDRFRQADATTTRQHGGLGLGLAIVKQLVELHGGTVRAESPGVGQGATFVVALPLVAVQPEPVTDVPRKHPRANTERPENRRDDLSNISVLVVDDEPDSRELVKRLLEDCNATVTAAGSVREALEIFPALHPDVLVSDIGMPGEDGYSLIRHVRRMTTENGGRTPAVALTAYARAEDRVHAMRAGFQHHVAKPVEPSELVAIVASIARRALPG